MLTKVQQITKDLFDCTYAEICNLAQNLDVNKATGLDRVPARVLKFCANFLAYPVP